MTVSAAPAYLGNPKNVDPEETFVASLSACHMLTFLAIEPSRDISLLFMMFANAVAHR